MALPNRAPSWGWLCCAFGVNGALRQRKLFLHEHGGFIMISHVTDEEAEGKIRPVMSQFHATIINLIPASACTYSSSSCSLLNAKILLSP